MTVADVKAWIVRNKWAVAFVLILIFGYMVGKDRALRDNARDAAPSAASTNSRS
jgi:hypothetical protein